MTERSLLTIKNQRKQMKMDENGLSSAKSRVQDLAGAEWMTWEDLKKLFTTDIQSVDSFFGDHP